MSDRFGKQPTNGASPRENTHATTDDALMLAKNSLSSDQSHSRTADLDSIRSLILLHPAGFTDGMKSIPTFQNSGEALSRDYSAGVLRLADISQGDTLYVVLAKAHDALDQIKGTRAGSDDRQALVGSLLLRPEVSQTGSGLSLTMFHVFDKIDPEHALACCFAGMLLPACRSNFEFYADRLLEEKPQLIGELIDRALSEKTGGNIDQDYLLSQISTHKLLANYIDRQFSIVEELDTFRSVPLVQRALNSADLTKLTRQEREELAEILREGVPNAPAIETDSPDNKALLLGDALSSRDATSRAKAIDELSARDTVGGLIAQLVLTAPYYPDPVRADAITGVFARNQQIGTELAKLLAIGSTGILHDAAHKISTMG